MSTRKPALYSIGKPTSSPVPAIANCTPLRPARAIRRCVIACAAPLAAISLPSIAPKTRMSATLPIVAPIPFNIDWRMLRRSMPLSSPTANDVRIRAKKASSFTTSTSTNSSAIAIATERSGIVTLSERGERSGAPTGHEAPRAAEDGQGRPTVIVLMGVAGAGKTTVGQALAKSIGWAFHDADDFHPAANVEKMRHGVPLSDADRTPWLRVLHDLIERLIASGTPAVLACSALRQTYRDSLLPSGPSRRAVELVQLDVPPSLAEQRLTARRGHYMPAALVASQFATLEEPRGGLR